MVKNDFGMSRYDIAFSTIRIFTATCIFDKRLG